MYGTACGFSYEKKNFQVVVPCLSGNLGKSLGTFGKTLRFFRKTLRFLWQKSRDSYWKQILIISLVVFQDFFG